MSCMYCLTSCTAWQRMCAEREMATLQVSMRLKEGHAFDDGHVGSYINGMGFSVRDHTVIVELEGDNLKGVRLSR